MRKQKQGKPQHISDIIPVSDISTWDGKIITVSAGTGTGKSYFIKNVLYEYAKQNDKKILMLIHRVNCVEQFQQEIERDGKQDTIHIMTYQKMEQIIDTYHDDFYFEKYEYVCCDEFHYFMGDTGFNIRTDVSLNAILNQKDKTRIFMSATPEAMKKYFREVAKVETLDYSIPINYNFIDEVKFYKDDEVIEDLAKEVIDSGSKAIFFIQSAKKAYAFYKKCKKGTSLFSCSKTNKNNYYKHVDSAKIQEILKNEKFEENILITTLAMDAGVNIKDREVKTIVVDTNDVDELIQCIGRRRIEDVKDKITLYIKDINNNCLGGRKKHLLDKIQKAEFLMNHPLITYVNKYGRDPDLYNIVYDVPTDKKEWSKCAKKVNKLMYCKCRYDIAIINKMLKYKRNGYQQYLRKMFGLNSVTTISIYGMEENLDMYLKKLVGHKLFKEDQQELINKINLRDARNRQQKSIQVLNAYLLENNLRFQIINKQERIKGENFNKRYWIISQIN